MTEALQTGRAASGRAVLISASAAIGGFLFGFDTAVINGAVDAVAGVFHLSAFVTGLMVAMALLGSALGAWVAGWLADRYGRIPVMLVAAACFAVSFGLLSRFSTASAGLNGWQVKLGGELSYAALPWLGVAVRYDYVDPVGARFQALSPRISLHSRWLYTDQIFIQYSRYFYQDAALPAGGLAAFADSDVVKVQAQFSF